jgi:S1-C subfamily serine protease
MLSCSRAGAAVVAVALALLSQLSAAPVPGAEAESRVGEVPGAVVCVESSFHSGKSHLDVDAGRPTFYNTGFVVGSDGEVLTSLMAVAGCSEIRVRHPDGGSSAARVKALDQASALALLETGLTGIEPFELAREPARKGDNLNVGCAVCESPDAEAQAGAGRVVETNQSIRLQGFPWEGLLAVDMTVPEGCAAAPVLNEGGRLAGVVLGVCKTPEEGVAREAPEGTVGACYVLPAGELEPILRRLRGGKTRRLGWLGLAVADETSEKEGALVAAVLANSPAHQAGIRPGDLLLQVGESAVESPETLAREVAAAGPRKALTIGLLRGGSFRTLKVDLEPRPLLVFSGSWSPDGRVRAHRPGDLELQPDSRPSLERLAEENRRLRRRVRELERRLERAEGQSTDR